MKRYHVTFWLANGNRYSYFVKAEDEDKAVIKAHVKMCKCEISFINEIDVIGNRKVGI